MAAFTHTAQQDVCSLRVRALIMAFSLLPEGADHLET